tara:strand:+ start:10054 stop:10668 length:615 start_codon:yes stop_codon:yes gene_type:complete
MFGIFQQKNRKFFNVRRAIASLVEAYYRNKEDSDIWEEFSKNSTEQNVSAKKRSDDLIKLFTQDIQKSYSVLVPGKFVAFNYTSLKGANKSYLTLIIGTKRGKGVYYNTKTKHTLMSCFLVNQSTNLNTLALVADVLRENIMSDDKKTYSSLTKDRESTTYGPFGDVRERSGVSKPGMKALFPTSEFRTFILETGMQSMYEVTI